MLLADDLGEGRRPKPVGKRSVGRDRLRRPARNFLFCEQVGHRLET
jgi:hypothetical protein